jgi:type VI secretion system secreted protein Hcp
MNKNESNVRPSSASSLCRTLVAAAFAAATLVATPALGATFEIFLKLQGIDGEAARDQIELSSYAFGGGTIGDNGTGRKPSCGPFELQKKLDKASPKLMQSAMTGASIPLGQITLRRSGGTQLDFYTIEMTNVSVVQVAQSGASGDDVAVESVELKPMTYKMTYKQQSPEGAISETVFGWSCATNSPL